MLNVAWFYGAAHEVEQTMSQLTMKQFQQTGIVSVWAPLFNLESS